MEVLFGRSDIFPIGLGATCHVGMLWFDLYNEAQKAYPRSVFDHMELPMWAVYELVKSDFTDFFNRDLFKPIRRIRFKDDLWMTHCKYNIRFNGILGNDLGKDQLTIEDSLWSNALSFYTKQMDRWRTLIEKRQPLLFFRLEYEAPPDVIHYPQFYKPQDEYVYVEEFANWLQSKEVPYHIVWFTKRNLPLAYNQETHIATVPYSMSKPLELLSANQLLSLVKTHLPFLTNTLHLSIPLPTA